MTHAADELARHPAIALAEIPEIPLRGHDAAIRQEALLAVHDQRGDVREPAVRKAIEGRLEALHIEVAHASRALAARRMAFRPKPGTDRGFPRAALVVFWRARKAATAQAHL